jgi:hypothetical protein
MTNPWFAGSDVVEVAVGAPPAAGAEAAGPLPGIPTAQQRAELAHETASS